MALFRKYIHIGFFVICFFNFLQGFSQKKVKDSLQEKSFDELFERFNSQNDPALSRLYLNAWIKKAKKESNLEQQMTGYEISSFFYSDEKTLLYCDSILFISLQNKKFNGFSASAYRIKGEYYYKKRAFKKELDSYILAKQYLDKSDFPILEFSVNYNIGVVKNRIGEHKEALKIHLKNLPFAKKYVKNNDNGAYLNAIYAVAYSYNYLNKLDSAQYYNKLGFSEARSLGDTVNIHVFILNQGITHYYKNQFNSAIDSLKLALSYFERKKELPNSSESYYYLGKAFQKTNNPKKAIEYFKKVDTVFQKTNDISPIIKNSYKDLINYYKITNDLYNQLNYVTKLIKVDSILYSNEVYLNKFLIKEYDIPQLIAEKETIIKSLERKERNAQILVYGLVLFVISLVIIFYYSFKKQKQFKKRFEKIINNVENRERNIISRKELNLPDDLVVKVLNSLDTFEKNKNYLNHDLTLQSLAKSINSNTNYLSKIVNYHKKKSFSNYLNNLRIEHAVKEMQNNPLYRKYTIKAIANETGFSTAESFSKAFYKSKGIKPSYFLKELYGHI